MIILAAGLGLAQSPKTQFTVKTAFDVRIPVRDGITVSADIYRPDTAAKFPVLLERTPYDNYGPKGAYFYASRGYVVVLVDVRGKYDSEGKFSPLVNEANDGYDVQDWCAKQAWSNGKLGTMGGSYVGFTQWIAAPLAHPALTCMAPVVAPSNLYRYWFYPGGAFALSLNTMWGAVAIYGRTDQSMEKEPLDWDATFRILPLGKIPEKIGRSGATWYRDWLQHPQEDEYWKKISVAGQYDKIKVPALGIGGWYDIFIEGTLENFAGMRKSGATPEARGGQKLIIGPWFHGSTGQAGKIGEVDFGSQSGLDDDEVQLRWFDFWMKGVQNGIDKEPPLKLFLMGENKWYTFKDWPVENSAPRDFYLHSAKGANTLFGDGNLDSVKPSKKEKPDRFVYNPADPVPTLGGNDCCRPKIVLEGPYDQRGIERRDDVLIYTTAPLKKPVAAVGPVEVKLWAASSAENTDFTAKLVDVYPDGRAINICDGILRVPYREGFDKWVPLKPDEPAPMTIRLQPTANVFLPGHAIRVEISSSSFPRYDRNLNTAGNNLMEKKDFVTANQQVLHDEKHPSALVLTVWEGYGK
jgi:putative CocE/NonD family hydrolase